MRAIYIFILFRFILIIFAYKNIMSIMSPIANIIWFIDLLSIS